MSNAPGLEIRLATVIVRTLLHFESNVKVKANGECADGKSLLGLPCLQAVYGTEIKFTATGADAAPALNAIQQLFVREFRAPRPSRAQPRIATEATWALSHECLPVPANPRLQQYERY